MWSLASSNSLMCWLVMGLKDPQANKNSGTRWMGILVKVLLKMVKEPEKKRK